MKYKAAILFETGKKLVVDEIGLPPKLSDGQVLVKVITSGLCGAQINEIDATKGPDRFLPHLLGHEGYCEILETSSSVRTLKTGDFAVMHWRPSSGIQSLTPSYSWKNQKINAGWVTTFNEYAVVSENRLTRIDPHGLAREVIPLLGCALTTAYAVLQKEAAVQSHDKVLIFGMGGVGLSMLKVLKTMKIEDVCVVDTSLEKLVLANKFGAKHTILFKGKAETKEELSSIFNNRLPNKVIDTTGKVPCIELSYEISSPEAKIVLVGVPKLGEQVSIYTLPLHFGKQLSGSQGGGSMPQFDIPVILDKLRKKNLDFSDFPTHTYSLQNINTAIADLRDGKVGRMIIDMNL